MRGREGQYFCASKYRRYVCTSKESKVSTADGALGLADAAAIDMCEGVKGWHAAPALSVFVLLYW